MGLAAQTDRRTKQNAVICCVDRECRLPKAPWHGTAGGYSNHRCYCDPCREAFRANQRKRYQQRTAKYRAAGLTVKGTKRKK